MSNLVITNLIQGMPIEELSTLQAQVQACILDIRKTATLDHSRIIKYRYRIRCGTVTPKAMKKQVLQGGEACMLGVSLGSPKSQGDRFEGTIRWISQNFSRCSLVLADSIYRYTYQITDHTPIEEATIAALSMGHQFINDYQSVVEKYSSKCDFQWIKMSDVEQYDHFDDYHKAYKQLYTNNQQFYQQINAEAESYLSGLSQADTLLHPTVRAKNIALSAKYFLEESVIFTCLCEHQHNTLLYPGTIKPLQILSAGVIEGIPEPIRKLTLVRLNQSSQTPYFDPPGKSDSNITYAPAYCSSILQNLTDDEWSNILQYTEHRQFQAGDVLVQQGSTNKLLVILLKGNAEVLSGDWQTGNVEQTRVCGPMSLFVERSLLEGYPVSKTLAALSDGEILLLTNRSLQKMIKKVPSTALHLLKDIARVLASRLVHINSNQQQQTVTL
jgi:tRNA-dependent cyclodipeptide synthase